MSDAEPGLLAELAPAKLNLALHVRGRRPDGRHDIETIFAFCVDGDRVEARASDALSLTIEGPFAADLVNGENNLVLCAARSLAEAAGVEAGADLRLIKHLPVASGIGGGSADAAATLRLLTRLWNLDPALASETAPALGSDVPACLISLTARGMGAGDELRLEDAGVAGMPALLVNPRVALPTAGVFASWDGVARETLGDWREGRNDLETSARSLVPEIGEVLELLKAQPGAKWVRMSGSGATCFALFVDEDARDAAATKIPAKWWHLATTIR